MRSKTRDVFFDRKLLVSFAKGQLRFSGWNVVHSAVGAAFEPVSTDSAGCEESYKKKQLNDNVNRLDGWQGLEDASSGIVHTGDSGVPLVGGMTTFRNQDFADPVNN